MEDSNIQSFEQLRVWQKAQDLAASIYKLTNNFPKDEAFGLTIQVKRSAASVSANIAEGFGRKTYKDKLQFYAIAYGSLLETKNFVYLAKRLDYISHAHEQQLIDQIIVVQKLLNAFMRPLKK